MKRLAIACAMTMLVGCAQTDNAVQTAVIGSSVARVLAQGAIDAYPIVKGIALQAEVGDPVAAVAIGATIAALDPKVAQLQALLTIGTTDVSQLATLATTVSQQVQALMITSAKSVVVIPAAPAATK